MARRREPARNGASVPMFATCEHPFLALRPGAEPKARACDPRIVLSPNLPSDVAEQAAEARADHERDGGWPGQEPTA